MSEIHCPYSVRVLGCEKQGQRIGIFNGDGQVGEYRRNYHSFGESTFAPFISGGEWFALYSKDYTCTRLMRLPSCDDIGGEEPDSFGFCPVELYVPQVCTQDIVTEKPYNPRHDPKRWAAKDANGVYHWRDDDPEYQRLCKESEQLFAKWQDANPFTFKYAPFGFVAGCIWGDDRSWKVQFIDLSRVKDGVITRDDRFGYIELPIGIPLKTAIDLCGYEFGSEYVTIAVQKRFALSGEVVEA